MINAFRHPRVVARAPKNNEEVGLKAYASGMMWGEGPRWQNGALWLSDTQGGKLWTDASGVWMAHETKSVSNGLWFLPDGRLVGAMMTEQRIGLWNGSDWETYADLSHLNPGPLGDMVGDSQGNLYVDDVAYSVHKGEAPRPGRILFVGRDGTAKVAAEGLEFPNGIAFQNEGKTLVVVESDGQRLCSFSVDENGNLHDRKPYADLAALLGKPVKPDGICATKKGIWVATLQNNATCLLRDGQIVTSLNTGMLCPIACCVDETESRLFVTAVDMGGLPLMEAVIGRKIATQVVVFDI
jgi:sugar lactone lactonase YvrE